MMTNNDCFLLSLNYVQALSLLMRRADKLESILTDFDESDIPTQSDILAMNEWCLLHATFGDKKQVEGERD